MKTITEAQIRRIIREEITDVLSDQSSDEIDVVEESEDEKIVQSVINTANKQDANFRDLFGRILDKIQSSPEQYKTNLPGFMSSFQIPRSYSQLIVLDDGSIDTPSFPQSTINASQMIRSFGRNDQEKKELFLLFQRLGENKQQLFGFLLSLMINYSKDMPQHLYENKYLKKLKRWHLNPP